MTRIKKGNFVLEMINSVEYILSQKEKGVSYYDIRKELERNSIDSEEISLLIRIADDRLLESLPKKQKPLVLLDKKSRSLLLISVGVGVTILSLLCSFENDGFFIVLYGPILSGIGFWSYKSKKEEETYFKRPFAKRRDKKEIEN